MTTLIAFEKCKEITKKASSTFYIGSLFFPKQLQSAVWAIYAFCRTTDNIVDDVALDMRGDLNSKQFQFAKSRLSSRRALVQFLFDRTNTEISWARFCEEHPDLMFTDEDEIMYVSLHSVVYSFGSLRLDPFLKLIEGVEMDLSVASYITEEELVHYCYLVAGCVGEMICNLCEITDDKTIAFAQDLGEGMQLTNILRDIGEDMQRSRIYIPTDILQKHMLNLSVLQKRALNGKWGTADEDMEMELRFRRMMKEYIQKVQGLYDNGLMGVKFLPYRVKKPVQIAAVLYREILFEIEKNDFNVFTKRAYVSQPKKLFNTVTTVFSF